MFRNNINMVISETLPTQISFTSCSLVCREELKCQILQPPCPKFHIRCCLWSLATKSTSSPWKDKMCQKPKLYTPPTSRQCCFGSFQHPKFLKICLINHCFGVLACSWTLNTKGIAFLIRFKLNEIIFCNHFFQFYMNQRFKKYMFNIT